MLGVETNGLFALWRTLGTDGNGRPQTMQGVTQVLVCNCGKALIIHQIFRRFGQRRRRFTQDWPATAFMAVMAPNPR